MYRTFRPSSVAYNSTEPAHLTAAGIDALSLLGVTGDGSLSDDSDATSATLYASSRTDGFHSSALAVDFAPIAGVQSESFGVMLRMRQTSAWDTYPTLSSNAQWMLFERGNPSNILASSALNDFPIGRTTVTHTSGNDWYVLRYPADLAAIASSGLTMVLTTQITNDPGFNIPIYDVFEAAVMFDVTAGGGRLPHCRIVQRGNDGLGITGGQRVVQRRTIQSSSRATGIR